MKTKVHITNNDEIVELGEESLLEILRKKGIRIRSSCGGHATCSDCVVVRSGAKSLSDVNFEEKKLLGNVYYITKERLACQVRLKNEEGEAEFARMFSIEIQNLEK